MAAVVVFAAYAGAQDRPTSTVVVARHDLDPGEQLAADDIEVRAVEVPVDLAGRSFPGAADVIGAVTLGPIGAGELVQAGSVRLGDDDGRGPEFSFPVDRERALAGDVRPGRGGRPAGDLRVRFRRLDGRAGPAGTADPRAGGPQRHARLVGPV